MSPKLFNQSATGEQENLSRPEIIRPKDLAPEEAKESKIERLKERLGQETSPETAAKLKPAWRPTPTPTPTPLSALPADTTKSETLVDIEAILEEDLANTYFQMDPGRQRQFKAEGEKTAQRIEKLLQRTKVEAKNILKLILHWLKMIPGVSKFFIEQEAKIKTDKILRLKK